MELYVSNKEIDGNGSFEKPFSSLEKARDYLRKIKPDEDVNINIIGGRYFRRKSFELDKRDVLKNGHKITYRANKNDKVIFDGGIVIPFTEVRKTTDEKILSRIIEVEARKHIYEVDLSGYDVELVSYGNRGSYVPYKPSYNELFIDLNAQNVSRYPNNGDILMSEVIDSGSTPYSGDLSNRGGIFRCDDERCTLWKDAEEMCVSGIFNWVFAGNTLEVEKIDIKNKTITTKSPVLPGFKAHNYTRWFALNLLEEIDVEGEYYIDRKNRKLYFYPPALSESSLIQLSSMSEPMIVVEDCENVEFSGITFENSRGNGVYISGGNNCVINKCILRNLGMVGVQIGKGTVELPDGLHDGHGVLAQGVPKMTPQSRQLGSFSVYAYNFAGMDFEGGKNNGVKNSEIYSTGMGGVVLLGGDRKNLIPANNYVKNTKIHNVTRTEKGSKAAVYMYGVGNIIAHCEIYDVAKQAILFQGNDHTIEYNDIYDCMNYGADGGVIYVGRDIAAVGNKINYNFIHDICGSVDDVSGVCAIYFDDYASFNEVHGNYFYNVKQHNENGVFSTILWNRGGQTSVANNIFIDCSIPIRPMMNGFMGIHKILNNEPDNILTVRALSKDSDDMRGVDITSPIYRERYPYLYELYEGTYKNQIMLWNNVTIMNDLSGFEDAENLNFTIKEDNLMVRNYETVDIYDFLAGVNGENRKIEITDFKKIGIQNDI